MKHNIFRCIVTKGQIWEGCTAFKKALALAVTTNIFAKTNRTHESRALVKSSAIETSSQNLRSPNSKVFNPLFADGPEKS